MSDTSRLLKVCQLLNEVGAKYLVAGAYAMILNNTIRATQDVDILIEESVENFERVIAGLSQPEAIGNAQRLVINGIEVPYLSVEDLIRSKETYRDQDRIDVEWLRRLQRGERF